MTRYGFLGLGIMGKAMAANLLAGGLEVTVWNRTTEKCAPLAALGARIGNSPAEVVADCDITFAMVSDPAAAAALFFGEGGVLEGIVPGKAYVDISTVDPTTSLEIARAVNAEGGRFLEAPVSGSKKPAEDGTLVFLCSGDESLFHEAKPALDLMGKKSFYFDKPGQGAEMKLVINMIMGTMMTAFAEGLTLGDKAGLGMADILDVLTQGAIDNPMFRLKGPQMASGNFTPAFPLKHMQKDMRLALELGDKFGQPLFTAAAANNLYLKSRQAGNGDEDFSTVFQAIAGN
ncbi:NAD(P)-dependent oxidoreductase [Desulforhopalus sp. IMCC35007]|uniref:NAD(P)-dependent oxidoreductase n=1 Tax=Desulforhopalus sp. IMCC35007 TaxID=2569543 RepID=UPI0010ADAFC2|nr:NAD(P)-dependent oxidoreductase [Desulforhopalus sp. IMCC35007]TKB08459.1 NAD(P)-dependent oxidoreductase [Desulforhopalus sp. IMCC35007]